MARYRVQGPDGHTYVMEGPDGASDADVLAAAQQQFGQMQQQPNATQRQNMPDPHPAASTGAGESFIIGAGRATDQIIDGAKQAWYGLTGNDQAQAQLAADQAEKARLYKPLADAHPVATGFGEAMPAMAVPVGGGATLLGAAGRLALAGAVPGALEYGSLEDRAGRAATGAASSVIGGAVIPKVGSMVMDSVPAVARTAKALVEPLTQNGRANIVGRTLNNAAGADAPQVAQRLASASPLVPGSLPTAGQVAENGGIAALERAVSAANPSGFTERAMDQGAARVAALRGLAGDDARMAAAQSLRKAVADPLYNQASAQVVTATDPVLLGLLQRPSVAKAIGRAQNLAAEQGRQFGLDLNNLPGKVDGRTLQDLKMGLDALLADPTAGIAGAEQAAIRDTRGQLMNWMENAIPELRAARTTYADLSKPIGQMQIGQTLLDKLRPALAEHGVSPRETASTYATALRNADQTARKATGFKGAGMQDTLTPDQMDLVTNIAKDLARKVAAQDLGRGVGSNTAQNLAMGNLAERSGAPGVANWFMNLPGVNRTSKFLFQGPEEQIQSQLAQALLDPAVAAQLMGRGGASLVKPLPALSSPPGELARRLGMLSGLATANEAAR